MIAADRAPLHIETRNVGALVPLDKPRTVTRKDGATHTTTHRRVLPWENVYALALGIVDLARAFGVVHAVIERVEHVHLDGSMAGAASSATALVRSGEVGAAIGIALQLAGVTVECPTRGRIHLAILKRAGGVRGDARSGLVGVAVAAAFPGWPTETNAHERDAAAAVAYAALPAPPPRPVRARGSKRGRSPESPEHYAERLRKLREEHAAAREASGCICGAQRGRHKRECPCHVPKFEKLARAAAEVARRESAAVANKTVDASGATVT
jgi:hypothetical protein